jgi:hypothetical protein
MLAPIVTAYEQAMTEGEGKNTWRTDRHSPCPRHEGGRYLAFLSSIGYHLSDIEQAVANGAPYTEDAPLGDSLPGIANEPTGPLDPRDADEPRTVSPDNSMKDDDTDESSADPSHGGAGQTAA